MSALQVNRVVLACDGCGTHYADGDTFPSPMDARGTAYGSGWRFPPMTTRAGSPAAQCSDVCPECLPGWVPRPLEKRAKYLRVDGTAA